MKLTNKLNLLIYPLLQIICFVGATYFVNTSYIWTGILVFGAAFFMSYALHISYHFHVHHKPKSNFVEKMIDFIISILLGMPYHSYQFQHLNHHKFDNEIGDVTSTYYEENGKVKPKSFILYVFFWILEMKNMKSERLKAIESGFISKKDHKKMILEGLVNVSFMVFLLFLNWHFAVLFAIMFYVGWTLISLHNYSQHLPFKKHQLAFSYYGKLYNWLFMNNGLHYEHHKDPALNYWELVEEKEKERTNKYSHIFDGFRFFIKVKEENNK